MDPEKILLWSASPKALSPEKDFQPYLLKFMLDDGREHGAVIVIPGGGYTMKCTTYEGVDVARRYNEMGFHAFMLDYRCGRGAYPHPAPLQDASRAVKIVRGHAAEWKVIPDKIATLGFSAGGHLCASTGVWYDKVSADNGDACDAVSARPDALILCYPVISPFAGEKPHCGSFNNLLDRDTLSDAEYRRFSCDEAVTGQTPPTFLWHTREDNCVPWENSLAFAQACWKHGVTCELHIFPRGHHGLGMGTKPEFPEVRQWPALSAEFLRNLGF